MLKQLQLFGVFLLIIISWTVCSAEQPGFDQIKQSAEQGDALAQAKYGSIYFLGENYQLQPNARFKTKQKLKAISYLLQGIEKNDATAAAWLLKAAQQGNADAEVFIAALYDRGIGVQQNEDKATEFYKKASNHGNEMAQAILGKYARSRLTASKDIPVEYALKILNTQ